MYLNKFIMFLSLLLLVSCGGSSDEEVPEEKSELIISPASERWGQAVPVDVKAVALSAGKEVLKNIPGLPLSSILLKNKISETPVTLYERGDNDEYIIGVKIDGRQWARLAYQFSHELTHVIINYGNTPGNVNQWFEEAVCEAASIQTVKDMSVSWQTNPPYPNWQSYSSSLANYYASLITEDSRYLSRDDSMANWYQREKNSLREDPHQRDKNEIVGTKVFYFLNESPERWRALKYMNIGDFNGDITLKEYLQEWETALPGDLKYVAVTISSWFEF